MRTILSYSLIITVFLGVSSISFADEEVKTAKSEITIIYAPEKCIGVSLGDTGIKMHINENTKVTKEGKDIKISDLNVGDIVEISYVQKDALLGLDETYTAKMIKVAKVKTEGRGKVLFVEPETKSISITIGDTPHLFGVNKDTTFKGVENLAGVEKNDTVFVDYKIGGEGKKILILLQKKSI